MLKQPKIYLRDGSLLIDQESSLKILLRSICSRQSIGGQIMGIETIRYRPFGDPGELSAKGDFSGHYIKLKFKFDVFVKSPI